METDLITLIWITFLASLPVVIISVAAHMYVAYKKAPSFALNAVKRWLTSTEGQGLLVDYVRGAMNTPTKGKDGAESTLLEDVGDMGVAAILGYVQSPEGKDVLGQFIDASGSVIMERFKEYMGSMIGKGTIALDELKKNFENPDNPIIQLLAGMKGGKKLLNDPMTQMMIALGSSFFKKGDNGGGGAPPGGGYNWN